MKRNSFKLFAILMASMLAGVSVSCSSSDEITSETSESNSQKQLTLTIRTQTLTRAVATTDPGTAKENTMNRIAIGIFDQAGNTVRTIQEFSPTATQDEAVAGSNKFYNSGNGTATVSVVTTQLTSTDQILVAINAPASYFAGVATAADFKKKSLTATEALYTKSDATSPTNDMAVDDNIPMFGSANLTGSGTSFSATIKPIHLVSKVTLESLKVDFASDGPYSAATFTPQEIFIYNAPDGVLFDDAAPYVSTSTLLTGESSSTSPAPTKFLSTGVLSGETTLSGSASFAGSRFFYTTPNNNVSTGKTKLVIKGSFDPDGAGATPAQVVYYPVKLNSNVTAEGTHAAAESGTASIQFEVYRNYFVNTDGTEVVQNRRVARVMLTASVMAPDGMTCPLNLDYLAYDLNEFPTEEKMIADAKDLVERLKALRTAPIADPYTGPAILSGPASGVFFHEIFGHRLEAHRMKSGGQTFKKMVGQKVLPETFSVYCDPTLQYFHNNALNGYYKYDDEGVKAQRVMNVTNGVLTNFLMSRVPLEGFPQSNGHGRMVGGNDPVSRQSNLIVETSKPYTDAQLRKMLIDEAKKQHKPYGYFFKTVTSGFTLTGEGGSLNSFNVTPIEVYRVYVDGRKDELVRGVDMIGTPLSMFSNIAAAGNSISTFTGMCGAESGWVPVSASSPMIFVSKIETQRRQKEDQQARILPAPELKNTEVKVAEPTTDVKAKRAADDKTIFAAMADELQRTQQKLFYPNSPKAFYVDYNMARSQEFDVMASLGGIVKAQKNPVIAMGGISLKLGDYQNTSDMKPGQFANLYFSSEVDYDNIRRELRKASDMMYKYSLNSQAYKQNYMQNNPRPEEERGIPDMLAMKPNVNVDAQPKDPISYQKLENLAQKLSAIFLKYPALYNTYVNIHCKNNDIYRLNTEGIKQKACNGYAEISAHANVRTSSGSTLNDRYYRMVTSDKELDEAALIADIEKFAERLMEVKQATPLNYVCVSYYRFLPICTGKQQYGKPCLGQAHHR